MSRNSDYKFKALKLKLTRSQILVEELKEHINGLKADRRELQDIISKTVDHNNALTKRVVELEKKQKDFNKRGLIVIGEG